MKNVLVSGGAGFIGFALARELARSSETKVFLVDNFVRGHRDAPFRALIDETNVELVELDLADPMSSERLPDVELSCVYHFAALNGTQNFYERPYDTLRCSTLPTFTLVERYVRSRKTKRFLYAGSSESYASTVSRFDWPVPTSEEVPLSIEDPLNPRWSYSISKTHGEVLTAQACREFGVDFTIVRYHNVYGPRMGDKHVIPDFVERLLREEYALYGHEETRSFLYIDDAVAATIALSAAASARNEIVNVGGETEVSIRDLGELMLRAAGRSAELDLHPAPAGCVARRAPDVTKLKRLIGFEPKYPLERGLAETVAYYMSKGET